MWKVRRRRRCPEVVGVTGGDAGGSVGRASSSKKNLQGGVSTVCRILSGTVIIIGAWPLFCNFYESKTWEIHQKNNRHPRTCRRYMLMPNLNVQKTQQQSNLSAFYVNERPNNKPVRLFLRTTRCLEAHEELKMWYGMCFLLLLYYCILISLLNRSVLLL